MAEPPAAGALNVRTFLLGDADAGALREKVGDALEASKDKDALRVLRGAARRVLDEELAEVAAGFLDIDLGATAVSGWRKHEKLITAAKQTRQSPDETQNVELAGHTMTSTWKPRVEVQLGAVPLAKLSLQLTVSFRLVGLSATVKDGRLTRLSGGSGTVSARLALADQTLAERTAPFDACLSVPLGPGVPLLAAEPTEAEAEAAPSVIELPDATTTAGRRSTTSA